MSHQAPLAAAWPTSASRLENGRSLCGTWAFFCVSAGWGQHRGCAPSEFDLREGSQEKERAGGGGHSLGLVLLAEMTLGSYSCFVINI